MSHSRLSSAARACLLELGLEPGASPRAEAVVARAAALACAEIEPVHVLLGFVVESHRREGELTAA